MNENQRLKFKIVAFSSSKGTYGVGFEDSGSFGICLHVVEVREIIQALVLTGKCDDVEFRKLKSADCTKKGHFLLM